MGNSWKDYCFTNNGNSTFQFIITLKTSALLSRRKKEIVHHNLFFINQLICQYKQIAPVKSLRDMLFLLPPNLPKISAHKIIQKKFATRWILKSNY